MSGFKGDKARHNKDRKRKIARRLVTRALRLSLPKAEVAVPVIPVPAPAMT